MLESVRQAKIGSIIPVYKEIDNELDAFEYFAKLSNYGNKKNSIFLEDNEISLGTANPCLMVAGKDDDFEITSLNNLGKKFLNFIKKDFGFCEKALYRKDKITGKLSPKRKFVNEEDRLKLTNHMDIIRKIAFKFKPTTKPFVPYSGLFGMVSYDFISQIEDIPDNEDLLKDPDYVLYFLDNMFVINHETKKTYFIANALITDNKRDNIYNDCSKTIGNYEKLIGKKALKAKKYKKKEQKISYDIDKDEFLGLMKSLRRHILDGNILYAAPSRTATANYNAEPLDIYAQLKGINSVYINDGHGISIGYSAKATLTVENEKEVELKIITAAKPRGVAKDAIEKDLDNKYETLLKVDENEIAYSIMSVDDARNDAAKISRPGTKYVDKLFAIDKQDKFQSLSYSVKGILKQDFDALHAFAAIINPAVIRGIPKIKAMQLLGKLEKKRSLTSGSVVYITPGKDIYAIVMEPIRIKKDKAYFRASSRVFNNSEDNKEFNKSNAKAMGIIDAIKSAGGIK